MAMRMNHHAKSNWSSPMISPPFISTPLMFGEKVELKNERQGNQLELPEVDDDDDLRRMRIRRRRSKSQYLICCSATSSSSSSSSNRQGGDWGDWWKPHIETGKGGAVPSLSDILWPSAGAFAAMALLGKMDQLLHSKGLSMTIAPLGAVSAVLFATPNAPGARKYNMFVAQMGCAAIGVMALSAFGPGWLARSFALAASIAFMIFTRAVHPPAASLPILFIDGPKFHHLNLCYALFPGAAGCVLLCILQEIVSYLKENFKF